MAGGAWAKLEEMIESSGASTSQAIRQIAGFDLTREETKPLLIYGRWRSKGIFLEEEVIDQCRTQARQLFIVSSHQSQECVGLVVEAYVRGLVQGPRLSLEPRPIKKTGRDMRDVHLSGDAWRGLKELFGRYPSKKLNNLALDKISFMVTNVEIPAKRRQAHHTHLTAEALEYFAEWSERLGIDPPARMGLISWASIFLEYFGRGGISIVRGDTDHDLHQPRRRARSQRGLVGTGV